jgi:hypothetical protein
VACGPYWTAASTGLKFKKCVLAFSSLGVNIHYSVSKEKPVVGCNPTTGKPNGHLFNETDHGLFLFNTLNRKNPTYFLPDGVRQFYFGDTP